MSTIQVYKPNSVYAIEEFTSSYGLGVSFLVRDASWVTDEEVREGRGSPVVAGFDTRREAINFCRRASKGAIKTWPHESNFIGWPALRKRVERAERRNRAR